MSEMITVPKAYLDEIMDAVINLAKETRNAFTAIRDMIEDEQRKQFDNEWVYNDDVPALLHISPKTWERWRTRRVIASYQYGRKIYVNRKDIEEFMEKHRIDALKEELKAQELLDREDLLFNENEEDDDTVAGKEDA